MSFLDLLQAQGDKVTLTEMLFTRENLPESNELICPKCGTKVTGAVTKPIPDCMFREDKTLDLEIFNILAWIIARRENHDITKEEVGDLIGIQDPDQHAVIIDEILYFFTTLSREQLSELRIKEENERAKIAEGEEVVEEVENPTPEMAQSC